MARGFAGGIILGSALAGLGLVVLSQLAPLTEVPGPGDQTAGDPSEAAKPAKAPAEAAPAEQGDTAANAPAVKPAGDAESAKAPSVGVPDAAPLAPSEDKAPTTESPTTESPRTEIPTSESPSGASQVVTPDPAPAKPAGPGAAPSKAAAQAPLQPASEPDPVKDPTQKPSDQSAEPRPDPLPAPVQSAEPPAAPQAGQGAQAPQPLAPAADAPPPSLAALDAALTAPQADTGPQDSSATELGLALPPRVLSPEAPDLPEAKPASQPPSLDDAATEPALQQPARLPQISAEPDPALLPQPLPQAATPPQAAATPARPGLLQPDPAGMPGQKVTGLARAPMGGDLPQIGKEAVSADTTPEAAAGLRPLEAFARPFEGAGGKPLFVILLRDLGAEGLPRAQLAQLPFPVSIVLDPLAPDAAEAAAAWAEAGQEVIMLASGIPQGATAADVAQSFEAHGAVLPRAVAVLDLPEAGFQTDRALADLVLDQVAAEGRGLLTWDRGLNAADQIARREGLPAAVIYRVLDGAGESQPVMSRYLDRAAFKAGQEGGVVVIGDSRSETVEVLLEWALEGKGASVALAPVSALLLGAE